MPMFRSLSGTRRPMIATCWHCGESLPPDPPQANVAGVRHAVCCNGCRAVAEWIADLGLADYYRLRTGPAARAPDPRESEASAVAFLRPELSRHLVRTLADGSSEAIVLIDGMHCTACCWLIERTLGRLPGVVDVSVNAGARRARIVFDAKALPLARIVDALGRVGYRALPLDRDALDDTRRRETRDAQKRLAVAGFGAMQAMMYASALWFGAFDGADAATRDFFRWLTLLAATPVVFYSAGPFFAGALRLAKRAPARDGCPGGARRRAHLRGQRHRDLRRRARTSGSSRSACSSSSSAPAAISKCGLATTQATCPTRSRGSRRCSPIACEADGTLLRVGAFELVPGDRVVVAEGGSVPADGVLETEQCRVDEALLCGESTPRQRRRGEALCAGSIVVGTPATMRVTRVGADTVVAGIVALTTRAASSRPRLARAGERAAAGFVARVLVLAICTAIGWAIVDPSHALAATVAVLVVACPCAFALAAPAAVTRALAVLTERNVLVVRPDALEDLASVTHVLFDKTGTLTEPAIAPGLAAARQGVDRDAALAVAAALAQGARHPLARAFVAEAPATLPAVEARESVAGRGIGGVVGGRRYRLGRADYALGCESISRIVPLKSRGRGGAGGCRWPGRGIPRRRASPARGARSGRCARSRRHRRHDRERGRKIESRSRGAASRRRGVESPPVPDRQARASRIASRAGRPRGRRRRRRERCAGACRRRRGDRGGHGGRCGAGGERHRDHRAARRAGQRRGRLPARPSRSWARTGAGPFATTSPPFRSPPWVSCLPGLPRSACRPARSLSW